MSIIIAGGAGFIGTNLVKHFIKRNKKIFIIDNFSNSDESNILSLNNNGNLNIIKCDLSIEDKAKKAINEVCRNSDSDIQIWHLAANSDIPSGILDSKIDLKDTFMTTFNLLEMAKIFDIKSFFFASSSAVYGDHGTKSINEETGPMMPISNYGAMKLASEAQCFFAYESFLEKLRIFRFPNVVGSPATHGVILDFINKLKNDPSRLEVLGDGSQKKSYLHVSDLIEGMIHLSEVDLKKSVPPVFNLGPENDSITVRWIAEQVILNFSPNAKIEYGKSKSGWLGDVPKFSYNTKKSQEFGWKPKMNSADSIKKAIQEIIKEVQ